MISQNHLSELSEVHLPIPVRDLTPPCFTKVAMAIADVSGCSTNVATALCLAAIAASVTAKVEVVVQGEQAKGLNMFTVILTSNPDSARKSAKRAFRLIHEHERILHELAMQRMSRTRSSKYHIATCQQKLRRNADSKNDIEEEHASLLGSRDSGPCFLVDGYIALKHLRRLLQVNRSVTVMDWDGALIHKILCECSRQKKTIPSLLKQDGCRSLYAELPLNIVSVLNIGSVRDILDARWANRGLLKDLTFVTDDSTPKSANSLFDAGALELFDKRIGRLLARDMPEFPHYIWPQAGWTRDHPFNSLPGSLVSKYPTELEDSISLRKNDSAIKFGTLLHVWEVVENDLPWNLSIKIENLRLGASIQNVFARQFDSLLANDVAESETGPVQILMQALRRIGRTEVSKRELHQCTRGTFGRIENMKAPLQSLLNSQVLTLANHSSSKKPGRPKGETFYVNPKFF